MVCVLALENCVPKTTLLDLSYILVLFYWSTLRDGIRIISLEYILLTFRVVIAEEVVQQYLVKKEL